jgi:hypothetical protein
VHADYTDPILPPPSGRSLAAAAAFRKAQLKPLVRGRMHLLTTNLRRGTRTAYASGRRTYEVYCMQVLDAAPYPASPAQLMDFAVWCILVKKLDSSTVANKLRSVFAYYDFVRLRLCFRHVRSPARDPELLEILRVLGVNFKKAGGGRLALSVLELIGLFARGFTSSTRRGLWSRLYGEFLNFGMLRDNAVKCFKCCYEIDHLDQVTFLPDSEISIYWHAGFGAEIVDVCIKSDKIVDARRAAEEGGRHSYIPGALPLLGVFMASDLRSYLVKARPPSGGPLLAYPDKKGYGFSLKFPSFNKYLRDAYRLAFPGASDEHLSRIGTHSGRKTLAQMLWDHGFSRQLIAAAGGWFIKREAVDLYFSTSPVLILRALAQLRALDEVSADATIGPFRAPAHQQA